MYRHRILIVVLLCLLALQVALLRARQARRPAWHNQFDKLVPQLNVADVTNGNARRLGDAISVAGRCVLVVGVDPRCGVCQRMRFTWPRRFTNWSDSVGLPVNGIWLSVSDSSAAALFFGNHEMGGIQRLYAKEAPGVAVNALGLVATPTLYLFGDRVLKARVIGDAFPSVDSVARWCRG